MASIEKRKDGYYRVIVSCGYDVSGKKIRKYKTIKLSPNLTERQKHKELERQKILFENEVLNKNYLDGEKITFAEFTKIWIEKHAKIKYRRTCTNNREHKQNMSAVKKWRKNELQNRSKNLQNI